MFLGTGGRGRGGKEAQDGQPRSQGFRARGRRREEAQPLATNAGYKHSLLFGVASVITREMFFPDFDLEEEEPHLPAPTEEELDETLPTPPPVPQSLLVGRQV